MNPFDLTDYERERAAANSAHPNDGVVNAIVANMEGRAMEDFPTTAMVTAACDAFNPDWEERDPVMIKYYRTHMRAALLAADAMRRPLPAPPVEGEG